MFRRGNSTAPEIYEWAIDDDSAEVLFYDVRFGTPDWKQSATVFLASLHLESGTIYMTSLSLSLSLSLSTSLQKHLEDIYSGNHLIS